MKPARGLAKIRRRDRKGANLPYLGIFLGIRIQYVGRQTLFISLLLSFFLSFFWSFSLSFILRRQSTYR